MVTRIHKMAPRRLYLREHRKAQKLSAKVVGERMEMERESLLRFEREWRTRCTPEKLAQYADAVQVPEERLWRAPDAPPSLDEIASHAPAPVQPMIVDIVRRMAAGE